jgi:hypothetical protein
LAVDWFVGTGLSAEVGAMLVEVAKPLTFFLCILSLYAVLNTALLNPSVDLQERISESIARLALAAAISLISGLVFRAANCSGSVRLTATLPVQLFCWAAGAMVVLFVVSWYVESQCIFYRDVRF